MDEPKTQLRTRKALKDRLNTVATKAGYTAELLADLLLSDALDQIEDELMPVDIMPHIKVLRRRLGKRFVESRVEAGLDRYFVARGEPLFSERVDAMVDLRLSETHPATPLEKLHAKEQHHQASAKTRYTKKKS